VESVPASIREDAKRRLFAAFDALFPFARSKYAKTWAYSGKKNHRAGAKDMGATENR